MFKNSTVPILCKIRFFNNNRLTYFNYFSFVKSIKRKVPKNFKYGQLQIWNLGENFVNEKFVYEKVYK